ncbi:DUF721 domain-containing protein [uncultured Paracoccus sp.]|uniref:DUF721 domain-containing protein n=1 Tax=uncultured Paracoccus sp. TaxID=189685 RepID=UPI00263771A3|nr:DUF721 domain-containing protein [uncultured Paracoccus sp.]
MVRSSRKRKSAPGGVPPRRMRGFEPAALLVAQRVREGAEGRGFAVTRLLTNWSEIVGDELARCTRPVRITHGKGFGGTLTILTTGPLAPLVQMQLPLIRDKVNACYGFNAVSRISITQTAAQGFAEGQAVFDAPRQGPNAASAPAPSPERIAEADRLARDFSDPALSRAMRQLAINILSRRDANDRKATT